MDLIQRSLKLRPPMPLSVAFSWFQSIATSLQGIQASQEQFMFLGKCIAETLQVLDRDFRSGTLSASPNTTKAISDFSTFLKDFAGFCQREASQSFFKSLMSKMRRLSNLDKYQKRLEIVVKSFQSPNLPDPRTWEASATTAWTVDQTKLHNRLVQLEGNRQLLAEVLDLSRESARAMVAAIQRQLVDGKIDEEEIHFYSCCLQHLSVAIADDFEVDPWTITPYEVEFGAILGSGMLGKVFRGRLGDTSVAVKVLKNELKISPVTSITRRQIDDWLKLDHSNILRVMGANILDDTPFLVTPFILGGNINNYIDCHPSCDRLKYLHQASLGLAYLHTQGVIHGNIKGSNILIDDHGNAKLCDYGLASLKADANSRALSAERALVSPSWAAPELFMGGNLSKACDVYSFGMTIYEVLAQEVPFGHVPPSGLRDLVVKFHGRPPRPAQVDAPQMSNDVWRFTQRCWHKTPSRRPASSAVSERLTHILSSPPLSRAGASVGSSSVDGLDPPTGSSMTLRTLVSNVASTVSENLLEFGEDVFDNVMPNPLRLFQSSSTYLLKAHQRVMKKPYERCLTLNSDAGITILTLSSSERVLLVGKTTGAIDVWDAKKGIKEGSCLPQPSKSAITCLKFSDSGAYTIRAASQTGELYTWHWGGSNYKLEFSTKVGFSVQAISDNYGERHAAFTQVDGLGQKQICMWRASGDDRYLAGMKSSPTCIAFSPTGSHLFVGDEVGTLSVWISETGQPSRRPLAYSATPTKGHQGFANPSPSTEHPKCISLVPSPNGKDVLVGYSNGEIRLWTIASGNYIVIRIPPRQSTTPTYTSLPLTFSSDGTLVLFPSFEEPRRRIEVHDVTTGFKFFTCQLQDWPEGAIVQQIILSPDKSRLILSFEGSTTVLIFCWPVEGWYNQIYSISRLAALLTVVVACFYIYAVSQPPSDEFVIRRYKY